MNNNAGTTDEDIRQIIGIQLLDVDIVPEQVHYDIAINYYRQYNTMPEINYILNVLFQRNENIAHHQHGGIQPNASPRVSPDTSDHSESGDHSESDDEYMNNISDAENNPPITIQELINYRGALTNPNDLLNVIIGSITNDGTIINSMVNAGVNINIANTENQENGSMDDDEMPDLVDMPIFNPMHNLNPIPPMVDVKKVIKDIESIPLAMYKNDTNPNKNTECLICYDQYVDTDLIRILQCSHSFHRMCIDDHFTNETYLCPYCKNPAGEHAYRNL